MRAWRMGGHNAVGPRQVTYTYDALRRMELARELERGSRDVGWMLTTLSWDTLRAAKVCIVVFITTCGMAHATARYRPNARKKAGTPPLPKRRPGRLSGTRGYVARDARTWRHRFILRSHGAQVREPARAATPKGGSKGGQACRVRHAYLGNAAVAHAQVQWKGRQSWDSRDWEDSRGGARDEPSRGRSRSPQRRPCTPPRARGSLACYGYWHPFVMNLHTYR